MDNNLDTAESNSNASTTGKSRPAEAADRRQTWGGQEVGNRHGADSRSAADMEVHVADTFPLCLFYS